MPLGITHIYSSSGVLWYYTSLGVGAVYSAQQQLQLKLVLQYGTTVPAGPWLLLLLLYSTSIIAGSSSSSYSTGELLGLMLDAYLYQQSSS